MKSHKMLAMVVGGMIGISPGIASATLMFQDGHNGYFGTHDTELREHEAISDGTSETFGSLTTMRIDEDGHGGDIDDVQALLRFDAIIGDGPDLIPEKANISKATLRLFIESGGNTINMLKMLMGWNQSDAHWSDFGDDGVSDDDNEASFLRELEGRPHSKSILGSSYEYVEIDVTDEVQAWVDGEANYGWAFTPQGDDGVRFSTSESFTPAHRPKLSVNIVPEPAALTIFGLGLAGIGFYRRRRAAQ